MDVGTIVSNALGGLIGGLALLLLMEIGKRLRGVMKQRTKQPKEVLEKTLLTSQEYKEILRQRTFYRVQGYATLVWLLCLIAAIIFAWVLNGTIWLHYKSIWDAISSIGLVITLACFSPFSMYLGFSPITSQEVERKRQVTRQRMLKEALGARPYGYIFQSIVFPVLTWLFLLSNVLCLTLILAFPPSLVHIPLLWVTVGIGFAIMAGIYSTYKLARWLYSGVKNFKKVPKLRQSELRHQFTQDEFKQ